MSSLRAASLAWPVSVQKGARFLADANCMSVTWEVALSQQEVPRGFEPRSLDSESRVLTVTPRDQMLNFRRVGKSERAGPQGQRKRLARRGACATLRRMEGYLGDRAGGFQGRPRLAERQAILLIPRGRQITLPGRLELPTLRLTASRSNQLSYGSHVDWAGGLLCAARWSDL